MDGGPDKDCLVCLSAALRERMVKRGLGVVAGVLVVLVVTAGGCGGSDETALTKAEYTKQSNAICEKGYEEKNAALSKAYKEKIAQQSKQGLSPEEQADTLIAVVVPRFLAVVEELEDLEAPEGDQAQVDAIYAAYRDGLKELRENSDLVLSPSANPFASFAKLARAYGLKRCATF